MCRLIMSRTAAAAGALLSQVTNIGYLTKGLKVRAFAVTAALLVVATLIAPRASAVTSTAECSPTGSPTIALDPGHGGTDYGTSSYNGLQESVLNLDIALRTKDVLVANGYRVCLTRTTQEPNWSNTQRAEYANSEGAVRFVLIHLNGSSTESVNYTKTFWGKKSKDLVFSQQMHDALWPALSSDPTGQPTTLSDGKVGQFATGALLKSNMPGTLVESVFLTNKAEADRLTDGRTAAQLGANTMNRRQQIAVAIAQGIMNAVPQK